MFCKNIKTFIKVSSFYLYTHVSSVILCKAVKSSDMFILSLSDFIKIGRVLGLARTDLAEGAVSHTWVLNCCKTFCRTCDYPCF